MNEFASILLGGLLVTTSITACSQFANAAEFNHYQHGNLNRNVVAFNIAESFHDHRDYRHGERDESRGRDHRHGGRDDESRGRGCVSSPSA